MDRIDDRIEEMLENDMIDDLLGIDLKDEVSNKLYDYQVIHLCNMLCALKNTNIVVDGSDTGTGKTFTTIALCKQLDLRPLIVCPKTIIGSWDRVCKVFGVTPLIIVNYETFKTGKQYACGTDNGDKREKSNYLAVDKNKYKWSLPKDSIVVFDEAHKCKNEKTANGKLLLSTKTLKKVIMLSATLSDTVAGFKSFGYLLKLYKTKAQARSWINQTMKTGLNKLIYPSKGSRMIISDLGDQFPKNQVTAQCYTSDKAEKINSVYQALKKDRSDPGLLTQARVYIESTKVPIIVDQVQTYLDGGYSVAVFVNFKRTLKKLIKLLDTKCVIYGDQSPERREKNIQKFQTNKERVILCIMQAGGQSISLHDTDGDYPRVSIISPSFSSIDLVQALGRIYRAGTKSPAMQRIVFIAKTCEEDICDKIQDKIQFTNTINDNDLHIF